MKFSLSWLKDFLSTDKSVHDIEQALTKLGIEVDEITYPYIELKGLQIAKILSYKKHPNADKLNICNVEFMDDNGNITTTNIICGAHNVKSNMKVVLASPGQYIPGNDITIKKAKIRGEVSNGMLCSDQELGLGENSAGIIEVDPRHNVGSCYITAIGLNLDEAVFDVTVTPNRGDCLGIEAIARDLAAAEIGEFIENYHSICTLLKKNQSNSLCNQDENNQEITKISKFIKSSNYAELSKSYKKTDIIQQDAKDDCLLFSYTKIINVKNCNSPKWLQQRLREVGIKPKSALVDITNYICYAYGQPMHVFDNKQVSGNLKVRKALKNEKITALDSNEYSLKISNLVVADDKNALSIAGIIGGKSSGCDLATTEILLESAFFEPKSIALTGRNLSILTDSRYRFERGSDFNKAISALEIAKDMIINICGGVVKDNYIDTSKDLIEKKITFDCRLIKKLIGIDVNKTIIIKILNSIRCKIKELKEDNFLDITIPSWRNDLNISEDIVEEIIRILGYDKIPTTCLDDLTLANDTDITYCWQHFHKNLENFAKYNLIRKILAMKGLFEVYSWSFTKQQYVKLFKNKIITELCLRNPINIDFDTMRPNILCGILEFVNSNLAKGVTNVSIFEIGNVHEFVNNKYLQHSCLGIVRAGKAKNTSWQEKNRSFDVFDIKGELMLLFEELGLKEEQLAQSNLSEEHEIEKFSYLHPNKSGVIKINQQIIAVFGELHPKVLEAYDIDVENIVVAEVFLDKLLAKENVCSAGLTYQNFKRGYKVATKIMNKEQFVPNIFPSIKRDLSLLIDKDISAAKVIQTVKDGLKEENKQLLVNIEIMDVYCGADIDKNQKSILVSLEFRSDKCTLQDRDINNIIESVMRHVSKSILGEIR